MTALTEAFELRQENLTLAEKYLRIARHLQTKGFNGNYYLDQYEARLVAAKRWEEWIAEKYFPIAA